MACCDCCKNTLNLGCINSCDAGFDTGIYVDALSVGTWILQLTFGNVIIYYSTFVNDGEKVIFTMTNLNENYTYTGQIISPAGFIVNILFNKVEYDCIEFSTKVGINKNKISI